MQVLTHHINQLIYTFILITFTSMNNHDYLLQLHINKRAKSQCDKYCWLKFATRNHCIMLDKPQEWSISITVF